MRKVYMHSKTIADKRGYEFEREHGNDISECLEKWKGGEKSIL